jgi:hypothetical protein
MRRGNVRTDNYRKIQSYAQPKVSKRRDAPYRSGKKCEWFKFNCETWWAANKERW